MSEQMRKFSFEGETLETMHGWMQAGAGLSGIMPTIRALRGLSEDLETSVDSLRKALTEIEAWKGGAAEGAGRAFGQGGTWAVESQAPIHTSAEGTDGAASGFVSTKSRMPSPAEAELTDGESSPLPIIGPILDRQKADEKRDRVTDEARQRMRDWQDNAHDSVETVRPLPAVPQPTVEVAPPRPSPGEVISGPDQTRQTGSPPSVVAPPTPGAPPPGPVAAPPPPLSNPTPPVVPGPIGGRPPIGPVPPPQLPTPPVSPAPPISTAPPVRPVTPGVPVLPFPMGGGGGGDHEGRRRAYGPGAFNSEEIARSRGGSGVAKGGVLGGVPVDDGHGRTAAGRGAVGAAGVPVDGDEMRRGGVAAGGGRGGTGAGSIMQPAVGSAGDEDDQEHKDKYAVESDEYFVGEPHKVAPPVIGGP